MNPSSDPQRVIGALRFLAELEALAAAVAPRSPADELAPRRRRLERVRRRPAGNEERHVKAL
ncbi:MAG: hypothetical protein ABR975_07650 [Vulcanimicrobiaceae bacterium]|jgi:hypothetical protein